MRHFRTPKTGMEMRARFAVEEADRLRYGIRIRRRNSRTNLVNYYDDINRTTWRHRCWKMYRLTQWKPAR